MHSVSIHFVGNSPISIAKAKANRRFTLSEYRQELLEAVYQQVIKIEMVVSFPANFGFFHRLQKKVRCLELNSCQNLPFERNSQLEIAFGRGNPLGGCFRWIGEHPKPRLSMRIGVVCYCNVKRDSEQDYLPSRLYIPHKVNQARACLFYGAINHIRTARYFQAYEPNIERNLCGVARPACGVSCCSIQFLQLQQGQPK